MAVDDHGLEVLKKSGEEVVAGNKSDYLIKVGLSGAFAPPSNTDAVTEERPDATTQVFKFYSGGTGGTLLKTITLTYTDSTMEQLVSGVAS